MSIILMLVDSGMRVSEICRLLVDDVNQALVAATSPEPVAV